MKGYIPSNLSLGAVKHPDKYVYILTLLYYGRVLNESKTKETFIPLSAKILHNVLNDYKNYLTKLISWGIIETNNRYEVGKSSKGYRFTPQYAQAGFRKTEIHSKRIIKKVTDYRNSQTKELTKMEHIHIWNCLKSISIDSEEARAYINDSNLEAEKYFSYLIAVDMIEDGTFFQSVDKTAGRVHNNITNLSRNLRPFLRYNGQRLFEIDIVSSQPFLFNVLINEALKNPSFLSYLEDINKNVNVSYVADVETYKSLTSQGVIYEYLMEKLKATETRQEFKIRFFRSVLYCKENPKYISKDRRRFKELFPTVSEIISFYKKEDYRQLAIQLQRKEAEIMINSISKRLAEKGIFILTIHDSILSTADNTDIIKQIIKDEFQNKYGLTPTIKIKGA